MKKVVQLSVFLVLIYSCAPSANIRRFAQNVLKDTSLAHAHIGISVFDATSGRYIYNHQADKYFVPASNTKIPTTYAAMKFLGDSIVGLEYTLEKDMLVFRGSGDPTLLHPDFPSQPVIDFLKNAKQPLAISPAKFTARRWGSGWGIGDITASYAPERNEIPVYGNLVRIYKSGDSIATIPSAYKSNISKTGIDWQIQFERPSLHENIFQSIASNQRFTSQQIPFVTGNFMSALVLLNDTLKRSVHIRTEPLQAAQWSKIHSRHTDSLLKPLMHRSDNLFAEQTLLMVGQKLVGEMNESKVIDTLLKTVFSDLPQKPRWADGSGLSRYNLFSPLDFIAILNKMRTEFGMERIKEIFPTGGEGTLSNFYKNSSGQIYAKTGTLSGVVALSGFLYTRQQKLFIFSVLVNNHNHSAVAVRRAVEKFMEHLKVQY